MVIYPDGKAVFEADSVQIELSLQQAAAIRKIASKIDLGKAYDSNALEGDFYGSFRVDERVFYWSNSRLFYVVKGEPYKKYFYDEDLHLKTLAFLVFNVLEKRSTLYMSNLSTKDWENIFRQWSCCELN